MFGSIFGYANRYSMNPDGVSYLRLAGYIAEGKFQQSVSSHWGPLISWLLAPFLLMGVDGFSAARLVLSVSGLGLLSGSWFLARRFNFESSIKFIVLLVASLLIASWTKAITPDLLMSSFLLYYLYTVTDPNILTSNKSAFLSGLFCGFSYLSKHYAFPFFIVHFPLMLALRGYIDNGDLKFFNKKFFSILLIGLISFLVIALPLLIAYQIKYARFTIGTSGIYNYAAAAPTADNLHPPFYGLRQPREYAIHLWEDPYDIEDSQMWSPFENKENFKQQIKLILGNTNKLYRFFAKDYFIVGILSVFILPVAFFINIADPEKKYLYGWIMCTIILYCPAFMLMHLTPDGERYFYTISITVLMLSFKFIQEIIYYIKTEQKVGLAAIKNLKIYILLIAIVSFNLSPTIDLMLSIKKIADKPQNIFRKIANNLNSVEFPEPYAIIGSGPANMMALYVAYYAEKKYLGKVLSADLEDITEELKAAGARSVLVSEKPNITEALNKDERYRHVIKINKGELGWDEEINVFVLK